MSVTNTLANVGHQDFGDIAAVGGLMAISMAFTFKAASTPTASDRRIFHQWDGVTANLAFLALNRSTDEFGLILSDGSANLYGERTSSVNIVGGTTYRVLIKTTIASQNMTIWVNGVSVATTVEFSALTGAISSSAAQVRVGRDPVEPANALDGDYSEVALWGEEVPDWVGEAYGVGYRPSIYRNNGILYSPHYNTGSLVDLWGGVIGSNTGGVSAAHSAIIRRAPKFYLVPSAGAVQNGAASLSATATVAAAGILVAGGASALTATAAVAATGIIIAGGAAALTGTATVTAAGDVTTPGIVTGAAALVATATLSAPGIIIAGGAASLTATATVTAAAEVISPGIVNGAAALTATATVTAAGNIIVGGAAALAATATMAAAGNIIAGGAAALTATATLVAAGSVPTRAAAKIRPGDRLVNFKIEIIRKGESLPFIFDRMGESIEDWICTIEVKKFPSDPASISRVIEPTDQGGGLRRKAPSVWADILTSRETSTLNIGTYRLIGILANATTDEKERVFLRFHVTDSWAT